MATMGLHSNGLRPAASMERTAYTNVRLLDPATGLDAPGTLITENGRIADLGSNIAGVGLAEDIRVIDGGGLCLAPGLIDMRVQIREPGEEHKESIATATAAAAAGGVTAMVCLPNTKPAIDDVSVVDTDADTNNTKLEFDGMTAQASLMEVRDRDGQVCDLTSGEFKLLMAFLSRPKRVLSRDQLMDLVGGHEWNPLDRTIDNQVARLRKKIEVTPGEPKLIKTVRGVGYTFACDVRHLAENSA